MKKIITAAAVVAMAIGAQAATIKWGSSGGVFSDATGTASATVDGSKEGPAHDARMMIAIEIKIFFILFCKN